MCVKGSFSVRFFCAYLATYLFQHLFASTNSNEVRQKMIDMAGKYVGIGIRVLKDPITLDEFTAQRLGKFRLVKIQFYVHVQDVEIYICCSQYIAKNSIYDLFWLRAKSPALLQDNTDVYLNMEAGYQVCLLFSTVLPVTS